MERRPQAPTCLCLSDTAFRVPARVGVSVSSVPPRRGVGHLLVLLSSFQSTLQSSPAPVSFSVCQFHQICPLGIVLLPLEVRCAFERVFVMVIQHFLKSFSSLFSVLVLSYFLFILWSVLAITYSLETNPVFRSAAMHFCTPCYLLIPLLGVSIRVYVFFMLSQLVIFAFSFSLISLTKDFSKGLFLRISILG